MFSATKLTFYQFISFALAVNYFSFHCEFDTEEYLENHRQLFETPSIARPSLNWESFDKGNAPKAFVIDPIEKLTILYTLIPFIVKDSFFQLQYYTIRDKSPPVQP